MDGDGRVAEPCNEMSSLYHEAAIQQALWWHFWHSLDTWTAHPRGGTEAQSDHAPLTFFPRLPWHPSQLPGTHPRFVHMLVLSFPDKSWD